MHEPRIKLVMLDVRDEADFNLFHIADAQRISEDSLEELIPQLQLEPPNTVFVVMGNGEEAATRTWKTLVAQSVPNVYILEGGVNNWLTTYAQEESGIAPLELAATDEIAFAFAAALGASYNAADPDPEAFEIEYEPKIKLELKRGPVGGGCG
jgi:rhodanese-related sulfurtransferase